MSYIDIEPCANDAAVELPYAEQEEFCREEYWPYLTEPQKRTIVKED